MEATGSTEMYSEFDYEELKQQESNTKKRLKTILKYLNDRKKRLKYRFKREKA